MLQLDPQFAPPHYFLGGALTNIGQYDEAIAHLQKATDLTHGASLMSAGLARGYALTGRRDQSQQGLRELQLCRTHHYVSPYGLAQVYAALGDKTAALEMLDRAVNEHAFEVLFLRVDRSFDGLHKTTISKNRSNELGSQNSLLEQLRVHGAESTPPVSPEIRRPSETPHESRLPPSSVWRIQPLWADLRTPVDSRANVTTPTVFP